MTLVNKIEKVAWYLNPFSANSAWLSKNPIFHVLSPLKFYDCLVFSRIINSYPLVAVFEFLVVRIISIQCFYFLVTVSACQLSLSKKKSGVLLLALLWGYFLPLFFRHNTLTCITPKEKWDMLINFLGLRAIHINMNKNSKLSTKGYFWKIREKSWQS